MPVPPSSQTADEVRWDRRFRLSLRDVATSARAASNLFVWRCFGIDRERPSGFHQSFFFVGIAGLSGMSYPVPMGGMKGITIKLPHAVAQRLRQQARQSGRSVAALIRERIEVSPGDSVYAVTSDLAGSLAGRRSPATNTRRRFKRP